MGRIDRRGRQTTQLASDETRRKWMEVSFIVVRLSCVLLLQHWLRGVAHLSNAMRNSCQCCCRRSNSSCRPDKDSTLQLPAQSRAAASRASARVRCFARRSILASLMMLLAAASALGTRLLGRRRRANCASDAIGRLTKKDLA